MIGPKLPRSNYGKPGETSDQTKRRIRRSRILKAMGVREIEAMMNRFAMVIPRHDQQWQLHDAVLKQWNVKMEAYVKAWVEVAFEPQE